MSSRRTALIAALMALILVLGGAVAVSARGWLNNDNQATVGSSACDDQEEGDDVTEADDAAEVEDNDSAADAEDDANEADCENDEQAVAAGTVDDGAELLPQAKITLEQAIAAAQSAANGSVGEVDLEYSHDTLVFNVDIGDHDVKVDATKGTVLSADEDD